MTSESDVKTITRVHEYPDRPPELRIVSSLHLTVQSIIPDFDQGLVQEQVRPEHIQVINRELFGDMIKELRNQRSLLFKVVDSQALDQVIKSFDILIELAALKKGP
jgi:hypothetical protein